MLKSRGWQTMARAPNPAYCLVLDIKFYQNTPTLIPLCFVCGCFLPTEAEFSSWDRDWRPAKPKIFIIWAFTEVCQLLAYRMMQEWNKPSLLHHLFFFNCVAKYCSIFQKSIKAHLGYLFTSFHWTQPRTLDFLLIAKRKKLT